MLMTVAFQFAVIYGVCDAADLTLKGSVGGSVELPSVLGTVTLNEFFLLQWNFNNSEIARLRNNKEDVEIHAQFKGRLQLSSDFSLTVRELTLQDSGVYQRIGLKAVGGQIPTHTIYLSVYENITAVQIQSALTWVPVNQTCEVHVMCSSSGAQSASYTWRKGDQTVRGRELHFSLSPAEGGVTVTCTVDNGVSEKSRNDTVRCSSAVTDQKFTLYIGGAVGAAVLGIIIIALLICCCRKKNAVVEPVQEEMTTYAVVNKGSRTDSTRSQSQSNALSLYETVGEVNAHAYESKAQTLYDKVTLNRYPESSPSPYQKVL